MFSVRFSVFLIRLENHVETQNKTRNAPNFKSVICLYKILGRGISIVSTTPRRKNRWKITNQ